jgi:putative Mg2+ transporter-C (MgtC) family protein
MYPFTEDTLKIVLSILVGAIIGVEREYRSKAAGFRTITLISVGSTLFTMVSIKLGSPNSPDRVAANIITGIGFLGAGVVFKDGFSVTGLTTATAIWVTAALGMTIGIGAYKMASEGLVLVLIVLSLFEYIQGFIGNMHQKRVYKIIFDKNLMRTAEIEKELHLHKLHFTKIKEMKTNDELICFYDVAGKSERFHGFNNFLLDTNRIKSFEC